jgi:hypothetical protein
MLYKMLHQRNFKAWELRMFFEARRFSKIKSEHD